MGIGAGLAFIAIGAILAFATEFELSGLNVQMIGWILMLVGVASIAFTLLYVRPRRVAAAAGPVDDGVYVAHPDEPAPHVHQTPQVQQPGVTPPHVHDPNDLPQPGSHMRDL